MTPSFAWKFSVPQEAIDSQGHVNNVAYVQWMQDLAVKHTQSVGGDVVADQNGIIWVVRSHEIEYLRQVFVGEVLRAETFIEDTQRATSVRRYVFTRVTDEKIVARGRTNWVCLDKVSGRPRAIPDDVMKAYDQLPNEHE
ncbi:acyl-CoA thioesterase [bacterium]|nr:acyl-CoA thioesterase [bacterium]